MERIKIAEGLDFSRLVYGMWRLGDDSDTSTAHVEAKIEACLAQGITTFDQADIYGGYTAEGILGQALKANPALLDQMEIVTKCDIVAPVGRYADAKVKHYDTSAAHITRSVETSLSEMGIDHIDLLLIHRPDPLMDHVETGRVLDDLVAAGKLRAVGVSNFRPRDWELLQSAMTTPLATNQIELSLSEINPFTNGDLAFHQRHGHPLMAWSPLGGGGLMTGSGQLAERLDAIAAAQGVDRAAVAIAFLLRHPAQILPVLGTNNLERIKQASDALKVELDRPTWFKLYEAALGREVA
ncbi:aldo/keto reductase [Phaeobacter gallaeciensis]|uniref:Aldo / keto reductase n=1 Tax=Phaeobacter gallaeciensis TaxID=60890 RepID=A0AAD0ED57_9RHOB|nr:aldo/keto reductase [Phaeobacter gallaeciensis]AHD09844.1 putative oxidoreductase [Phaeobacter gallaeciensis DSM 26640]ATE93108.1 aldo / keto reductase [Phaeobacter gallaeciensis]ATE97070.1 aldo / keto reductase [Phaeobacter gallaeciensis]ATF01773.1 aldo / keto reductase [Phaeobacter gallaeciensis]ATF06153.1 aldo / keto reductase [Phaeobacter gallaeciensis]